MEHVIDRFTEQAELFERFSNQSYTWEYVERPALVDKLSQLPIVKGEVLDIGCGTGRILQFLIEAGIPEDNLLGLDASPTMLHIASQKTRLPDLMLLDITKPLILPSS